MPDSAGSSEPSRFLVRLEWAFCVAFLVLLTLAIFGQAALLTERGKERLSRVDRLEGRALRVVGSLQ
ncbi:MAG: hypothetical protein GX492_06235 [Firmicutes bacterium]|nr:hypothetical protein [Bacillota bacterium]